MFPHFEERPSDSPFVERIWMTQSEQPGSFTSISTVFWSMVIAKCQGRISISFHGPETVATRKDFPPEAEWLGLSQRTIRQIERVRYATALLKQGVSILDTVYEAGYSDQPHAHPITEAFYWSYTS